MSKKMLAVSISIFFIMYANAQIGVMKLIGNNTADYALGFGAFIKAGVPVSDGADATLELGASLFPLKGYGTEYGTIMCPLKAGYRYTLNGSGRGFYVEPQVGFNLLGSTSLPADYGSRDVSYHGLVLAAGAGYLFTVWSAPFDVNLRYETVIAHGGSNNMLSFGISRFISFRKRDTDY